MAVSLLYLSLVAVAEALTALFDPRIGLVAHSLILTALLFHGASTLQIQRRRFLLALTLAPLIRILSISLPLQGHPLTDWYLIIGTLLFLAVFVAIRVVGLGGRRLGFTLKSLPLQLAIGLIGVVLGFVEYFILYPAPLIPTWDWRAFWMPAFILLVFTGILEEIIFRGLIQETAAASLGRFGIVYSAILFGILHLGYLSILDIVFVFAVGLMFGLIVARTRSLIGVSLAHGLTNISMYLVFPFILSGLLQFPQRLATSPSDVLSPPGGVTVPYFPGYYSTATPTFSPFSGVTVESPYSPVVGASPYSQETRPPCGQPPGWVMYIVKPGDTLYQLGQACGVSVGALQQANCIGSSTLLHAGEKLYLPCVPPQVPISTPSVTPSLTPTATQVDTSTPTQTVVEPSATPSATP